MRLELDHVVVCVGDLDSGALLFEERFGVAAVPGGRHPGHGTENRIIPLGQTYVELLTISDPAEADSSNFGRWVGMQTHGVDAKAICLRTDDLDAVCRRLALTATEMSRETPAGQVLRWRTAGLEEALPRVMPFFIQWDVPGESHPGRLPVTHTAGEATLTSAAILGDHVAELMEWAPEPVGLDYVSAPYREITYHLAIAADVL